jgi:hypothetical protein
MPAILSPDARRLPPARPTLPQVRRKSRRRWLFVGVALPIFAVVTILIIRSPLDELTAENLAAARARWQAAGIHSYDATLQIKQPGMETDTYAVSVRDGNITRLLRNGRPAVVFEPENYTITGLFGILEQDLDGKGKTFGQSAADVMLRVRFDEQTGLIRRYLRVIGGTGKSSELTLLDFTPVAQAASAPAAR